MKPNEYLWTVVNQLGWWFWLPFALYGAYGLHKMYSMAAARTALGRLIRTVLTLAFLCLLGTVMFNGLGPYGFHLLAIGVCLVCKQAYEQCKAEGRVDKPTSRTVMGRLSERMMAKHH